MMSGYLFSDFTDWLSDQKLTLTLARKAGCNGITEASDQGWLDEDRAEAWATCLMADISEIWPDGIKELPVLDHNVTVINSWHTVSRQMLEEHDRYTIKSTEPKPRSKPKYVQMPERAKSKTLVTPRVVIEATAIVLDLTADEITGDSRKRPLVQARHVAVAACRQLTDYSFPALSDVFGGRHHTTLLDGMKHLDAQGWAYVDRVVEYVEQALPALPPEMKIVTTTPLVVEVEAELHEALMTEAQLRGLMVGHIINEALRDFLPRLVPMDKWAIAEASSAPVSL